MSKINTEVCNINDEMQKLEENRQGQALRVVCVFFFPPNNYYFRVKTTQAVVIHKS